MSGVMESCDWDGFEASSRLSQLCRNLIANLSVWKCSQHNPLLAKAFLLLGRSIFRQV